MALTQANYDHIRSTYSLIDIAPRIIQQPFTRPMGSGDQQHIKTMCVWHKETDPSLAFYHDHFHCFSGGCKHGGIFDFFREYLGLTHEQTFEYLTQANLPERNIKIVEGPQVYEIHPLHSIVKAEQWHQALLNNPRAIDYWMNLGFTWDTITKHKLGWNAEWHRFVIPNYNHIALYGAKQRRDDEWARQQVEAKGQEWIEAEIKDIREQRQTAAQHNGTVPIQPTIDDIVKRHHPKYLWMPESTPWLYGEKILMSGPIPYVLVFSDEKSWIMAGQERCWAICIPSDGKNYRGEDIVHYWWQPTMQDTPKVLKLRFSQFFKNCAEIYWVGDNDDSGMMSAERRRKSMGRGRVVSTPHGKQLENYIRDGGSIEEWMPGIPRMSK